MLGKWTLHPTVSTLTRFDHCTDADTNVQRALSDGGVTDDHGGETLRVGICLCGSPVSEHLVYCLVSFRIGSPAVPKYVAFPQSCAARCTQTT